MEQSFAPIKRHAGEILRVVLLLIVGFSSSRTLIGGGYVPTHDAEYHIIRLWQFDTMVKAGYLLPRWAPDLDFTYGVPLFIFFYPLPNYVGEVFRLIGFSYIYSVHLVLAMGLIVSGITFYIWMRRHVDPWVATIASISYILAPYHSVDVFIRGSVGEVWAIALIPALLASIDREILNTSKKNYSGTVVIAICGALVLLSHNLVGTLGFVFAGGYGFIRWLIVTKNTDTLIRICYGFILAIILDCFYFLPVIFESSYVRGFDFVSYADHFPAFFQLIIPSWGSGFSVPGVRDQMSFQIGPVHILAISVVGIASLYKRKWVLLFMVGVCIGCIFLMLEGSRVIWQMIPGMRLIQYPWRFLSIVIIAGSFCVGMLIQKNKLILGPIVLVLIMGLYWNYTNSVVYKPRSDDFFLTNPDWIYGTTTYGNTFLTKNAILKKSVPTERVYFISGSGLLMTRQKDPIHYEIVTETTGAGELGLTFNYFPGWKATVDSVDTPVIERDGLISLTVPPGKHSIIVSLGDTGIRKTGLIISAAGCIVLAFMMIRWAYEGIYFHRSS